MTPAGPTISSNGCDIDGANIAGTIAEILFK
jgi:hypothetical protein